MQLSEVCREYLDATGDRPLRLLLDSQDTQTMAAFSEREVLALKTYYLVGGMPAVVNEYVESEDFAQVRALQNQILEDYTLRQAHAHAAAPEGA